ncbi:alanine racemase [Fuerstiella marisgermanici]|uniref:D-threonine aldolase n=1 Tax=Fuerstiella marisgermanici TaxID=1891926 RepID=A0A1P8WRZ6_9PLAN|nr:alanine racemase [Fuerstiella marisgermanici]APZ96834.1 D-threonine aldolase [Fuerstiella marisgermanici]
MSELRLDLDVLERNAKRISEEIASLGKMWRPHIKAHSQPRIAQTMIDLGACGVTAANVAEVEVMAEAGIPSALLAHLAVTDIDLDRLAAAAQKLQLLVTIDHFVHAERYSKAAARNGVEFNVLVDVDIGMHRTGVRPRVDATQLAKAANALPGVSVIGIMGYEGHLLTMSDAAEKKTAIFEAMNMLQQTRDAMLDEDLTCDIVSAGGSGSFWITGQHEAVTELQAGGGAFGDPFYTSLCNLEGVTPALTVPAEVVSRPSLTQAVINCGRKAMNPAVCPPELLNQPGATIEWLSAEHTVVSLEGPARDLKIGDPVEFAVGYSDHSILMHRDIQIYRSGEKIGTWPVIRRA